VVPLKGKWVFSYKPADGSYKARWVARGDLQKPGLDFNELFAAVVHKDSLRVFLAIVCGEDLELDQIDIQAAFLHGDIEEEVHMEPPEGSNIPSHKVCELKKTLYGLRQAPRAFNKALDKDLRDWGFTPTSADACVYSRRKEGILLMISLHVDDQLLASNSGKELDAFKVLLQTKYKIKDFGAAKHFLGFEIKRDRTTRKLWISQERYLSSVLERFNMTNCNPVATPLPSNFKPTTPTDEEFEQAKLLYPDFPKMAASILYASTISRPDLAHGAGMMTRGMSKWNEEYMKAAKHLLRYIRGTLDYALLFNSFGNSRVLLGYADADWGGCLDTRRSTTGYSYHAFGGPVAWKSRRQPTVAHSTTEAEYMATSDAAKQGAWLVQLLKDLGYYSTNTPLTIMNDNVGAIELSKNPVHHNRTKHIDIKHHSIREKVEAGELALSHVPSKENVADILTKSLPRVEFEYLRKKLGVVDPESIG
jgi:hypothetical protein